MIIVLYLQTGDKYIKQPAWPIQSSKMKKLKAINNLLDSALRTTKVSYREPT